MLFNYKTEESRVICVALQNTQRPATFSARVKGDFTTRFARPNTTSSTQHSQTGECRERQRKHRQSGHHERFIFLLRVHVRSRSSLPPNRTQFSFPEEIQSEHSAPDKQDIKCTKGERNESVHESQNSRSIQRQETVSPQKATDRCRPRTSDVESFLSQFRARVTEASAPACLKPL